MHPGRSTRILRTGACAADPTPDTEAPEAQTPAAGAVKTGLSMVTDIAKSKDASADGNGVAQTNIALVAVTVSDDGVIDDCVIDAIQARIEFGADGKTVTPLETEFVSKNVFGADYGMSKASSIGKEWSEQAAAFAEYAKGKTVEELKGIAVDENGKATDADLAATVTLSLADFLPGIEDAVNKAQHLGAQAGDRLALTSITTMSKSKDASADGDGKAQAYASVAAVTLKDSTVTSCYIDAVQANVTFDLTGKITCDVTAHQPSKNELGADYGMAKASSIGKEWNEQIAAFCAYVTGKTLDEVTGIAVNDADAPADADLAASVTMGIGDYQKLLAMAAE